MPTSLAIRRLGSPTSTRAQPRATSFVSRRHRSLRATALAALDNRQRHHPTPDRGLSPAGSVESVTDGISLGPQRRSHRVARGAQRPIGPARICWSQLFPSVAYPAGGTTQTVPRRRPPSAPFGNSRTEQQLLPADTHPRPDLAALPRTALPRTVVYCCGPEGLIDAVATAMRTECPRDTSRRAVHLEHPDRRRTQPALRRRAAPQQGHRAGALGPHPAGRHPGGQPRAAVLLRRRAMRQLRHPSSRRTTATTCSSHTSETAPTSSTPASPEPAANASCSTPDLSERAASAAVVDQ